MSRKNKYRNLNMMDACQYRELGMSNKRNIYDELLLTAEDKLVQKEYDELSCEMPGFPRSTFLMVFSPDGTKVASTHGNHNVYVTDLRTGKNCNTLVGHPRTPWCIAFHPTSNQILATGCLGGQVRIWDLSGGSEVWTTECNTVIASLAFHPVDRLLVIATYNLLYFWDWSQPKPFMQACTNNVKEKVRYVAFDRLGHKLVTGIANMPASSTRLWERTRVSLSHPIFSRSTPTTSSHTVQPVMQNGWYRRLNRPVRPTTYSSQQVQADTSNISNHTSDEDFTSEQERRIIQLYESLMQRFLEVYRTRATSTMDRGTDPMEPIPLNSTASANTNTTQTTTTTIAPSAAVDKDVSTESLNPSSVATSAVVDSLDSPQPGPSGIKTTRKRQKMKKTPDINSDEEHSFSDSSSDEQPTVLKRRMNLKDNGSFNTNLSPKSSYSKLLSPTNKSKKPKLTKCIKKNSENKFTISETSAFLPATQPDTPPHSSDDEPNFTGLPTDGSNLQEQTNIVNSSESSNSNIPEVSYQMELPHESNEINSDVSTSPLSNVDADDDGSLLNYDSRPEPLRTARPSDIRVDTSHWRPENNLLSGFASESTSAAISQHQKEELMLRLNLLEDLRQFRYRLQYQRNPRQNLNNEDNDFTRPNTDQNNSDNFQSRPIDPTVDHNYMAPPAASSSSNISNEPPPPPPPRSSFQRYVGNRTNEPWTVRQRLLREISNCRNNHILIREVMSQLKLIRFMCQQFQQLLNNQSHNTESSMSHSNRAAGTASRRRIQLQSRRVSFRPYCEIIPPTERINNSGNNQTSNSSNIPGTSTQNSTPYERGVRRLHPSGRVFKFSPSSYIFKFSPTNRTSNNNSQTNSFETTSLPSTTTTTTSSTTSTSPNRSLYVRFNTIAYGNGGTQTNEVNQEVSNSVNSVGQTDNAINNQQEESNTGQPSTSAENKHLSYRENQSVSSSANTSNSSSESNNSSFSVNSPPWFRSNLLRRVICLTKTQIPKSRRPQSNNPRIVHPIYLRRQRSPVLSRHRVFNSRRRTLYSQPSSTETVTTNTNLPSATTSAAGSSNSGNNSRDTADPEIHDNMELSPENVMTIICRLEHMIRQQHNQPQVRFYRCPYMHNTSVERNEDDIISRLYTVRAWFQRTGVRVHDWAKFITTAYSSGDNRNIFRGRQLLSIILLALMRYFDSSSSSFSSIMTQRINLMLRLCTVLTDTLVLNVTEHLPPPDMRNTNDYIASRLRLTQELFETERRSLRALLARSLHNLTEHSSNPNANFYIDDLQRMSVNDNDTSDNNDNGTQPESSVDNTNPRDINEFQVQDRIFQEHLTRLNRRLRVLASRLEQRLSRLYPSSTNAQDRNTLLMSIQEARTRIVEHAITRARILRRRANNEFHLIPQVQVNDVPVIDDSVLNSPVRPTPTLAPQRVSGTFFRPHFLHPLYGTGVAVVDSDIDEPQREGIFSLDNDFPAVCPHHRIQIWNMSDGKIPCITNPEKNVVVGDCKIHNDASVAISQDGNILVALLPSGGYLNSTTKLGVFSIQWENLGQIMYTASLEQNAVSVSLSATARYLAVGLASRRVSLVPGNDRCTMAQLFKLENDGRIILSRDIEKSRTLGSTGINCIRWSPVPGQGLVYATNSGHLKVLT